MAAHKEVASELLPLVRVYADGTVERSIDSPHVPPSPEDPTTGVSSKDISITPHISARLYLPKITDATQKLPVLVFFHGGGFCTGSAFSFLDHRYVTALVSQSKVLVVSVEYRLAPEHALPAAYEDSWAALQWVASHSVHNTNINLEPWLVKHGNFTRLYVGGESAGGNIVHYLAIRAGTERLNGDVKILGGFLSHPYFWGSKPIGSESSENREENLICRIWGFVYPLASGGIDNPMINPFADGAPSLSGIGCSRLLVCVSEKDELRERGARYHAAVKESGWRGEVELVEVQGEDHCFHVFSPDSENGKNLIRRLASFIMQ
ncbi:hypothetical protein RJ639_046294 [Escallonia herrerae]|uniref:Alpha/beta hydrolase fold-3 domain-containing protein n=1 Tax=Escallonia herrerae TaxID=1293975 RepID=A0AA89B1J0_9ASTE|nr:hypothetical protein RJ639_046294 [Escallonia herrerae]